MSPATEKVFLLFTVILAYYHCVCTPIEPDGPKFRFADGTILADGTWIAILYGTPLKLYCTGRTPDLEVIVFDKIGDKLSHIALNQTTIKIYEENLERNIYRYFCAHQRSFTSIFVEVDSKPVVTNFHCKSDFFSNLMCNWTSVNILDNSSLYYIEKGDSYLLCNLGYHYILRCIWDEYLYVKGFQWSDETLTFLLNSCNIWGCTNQTFAINLVTVTKLGTPKMLFAYNQTSHSVVLTWSKPYFPSVYLYALQLRNESAVVNYKIIFIYSGIHQFQINQTFFLFSSEDLADKVKHKIKLPCADTYYVARLSVKLDTAGEEFWSDEAVTSFRTDPEPEDEDTAVDATCEHRRVPITPDVMLFEIDRFKSKMREEQKILKNRIQSLKSKVEEIQSHLDYMGIYTMTKDFISNLLT